MKTGVFLLISAALAAVAPMAGCSTAPLPGAAPPAPPPNVTLNFDASKPGENIPNLASTLIVWDYHADWLERAEGQPKDYFNRNMPFVQYVQLMTATGGETKRDLFKNPDDRSVLDDYDFSPLLRACDNVLRQGLKPYIVTGNVPLKYSAHPDIGAAFHVNRMPPDDYEQYSRYLTALFQAMKDRFGAAELLTWKWGVLTEFENRDWFGFKPDPKGSEEAYFKLYDYTVAALQKVIGADVCVGAHSMAVIKGLWDERDFIDHCARGKNLATGETGTRLRFLTASYYDNTPADKAGSRLEKTIRILQDRAREDNLVGLKFGIDEGRILDGTDKKPLPCRAIGQTMQASSDARLFRIMLDCNISYFGAWGYTSSGVWDGAPSVSMHTANLFYKMVGEKRIPLTCSEGRPAYEGNDVDGFAGIADSGRRISVMAYAYNNNLDFSGSENVRVRIRSAGGLGKRVRVREWLVDDDVNFFVEWIKDRAERGITDDHFAWSRDSFTPSLKSDADRAFFASQLEKYRKRAELKNTERVLPVADGAVCVDVTLPHHAVVFLDIVPAR